MTSLLTSLAGSVVRHGATTGGGLLAGLGAAAQDPMATASGLLLAVGGFALSAYKEVTRHNLDLDIERHERLERFSDERVRQ